MISNFIKIKLSLIIACKVYNTSRILFLLKIFPLKLRHFLPLILTDPYYPLIWLIVHKKHLNHYWVLRNHFLHHLLYLLKMRMNALQQEHSPFAGLQLKSSPTLQMRMSLEIMMHLNNKNQVSVFLQTKL